MGMAVGSNSMRTREVGKGWQEERQCRTEEGHGRLLCGSQQLLRSRKQAGDDHLLSTTVAWVAKLSAKTARDPINAPQPPQRRRQELAEKGA